MKTYQLETIYRDFNDSTNYFYKREKNTVNGCPRYRVWIIDPEQNAVHEMILKGYEPISNLIESLLQQPRETANLERIRKALNTFNDYEYGSEPYKNVEELPELIPLAYTTGGSDEQYDIQISYNRLTCELIEEINGETINSDIIPFEDFPEFISNASFGMLVSDMLYVADKMEEGKR